MKENQMHAVLNDMHNLVDGLSYNQLLYILPQTHVLHVMVHGSGSLLLSPAAHISHL